MQDLRLTGVEDGALVLVAEDGARYRVPVDEDLKTTVRLAMPEQGTDRRLSPREIQALIRSGRTAAEVAAASGVALDYVERFEGPVLAERDFVTRRAQEVPVRTALDAEPSGATFGSVITGRLETMAARGVAWTSWKEDSGWLVVLTFSLDEVEHDARWQFDPKRGALSPANAEAIRLSQQGEAPSGLIPRLRVVGDGRVADTSRFDSGAFLVEDAEPAQSAAEPVGARAAEEPELSHTADLLEALRRRRGEREPAGYGEGRHGEDRVEPDGAPAPFDAAVRLVDLPLDSQPLNSQPLGAQPIEAQPAEDRSSSDAAGQTPAGRAAKPGRRGRASMPSWDDIVFGTRSDDDFA
ncbi:MAG: septation protein SepH [Microbacteriaceae bacterium]